MPPPRASSADPVQSPEQLRAAVEAFLEQHPFASVLEAGRALFDLRTAKYTLSTEHRRCTLHLWSEDRNLVRHVTAAVERKGVLRLMVQKFGQSKPTSLELVADRDRRTPSSREATRTRYLRVLERVLLRHFPEWKPDGFRTAMDLERSFGPAYARGSLLHRQQAWAVIAVNEEEQASTIDGILTLGILWLHHCRVSSHGRVYRGLKLIVPRGAATLTLSRMAWLNQDAAQWELHELDPATEELECKDASDQGNLSTHLLHAPDLSAAKERFAAAAERVLALTPPDGRDRVEQRLRSGHELAFLLHGLEFARARIGYGANSFNRELEISFGAGARETILAPDNESEMRDMVGHLFSRRSETGDARDPLFRMQPERWLESILRKNLQAIDDHLDAENVYAQVPAFAASDRGVLDLLGVSRDGRLAVVELKADEDLHLALQGLDYWIRVRWHHMQHPDRAAGLPEFQRHGYFGGVRLSPDEPALYLVAPALRVHPATEVILRYVSAQVDWTLIAIDERWRRQVKVVWRKYSPNFAR